MEELTVYALLLRHGMLSEQVYHDRLDALFLKHPDDPLLLELEWEPRIKYAIPLIERNVDFHSFDVAQFGKTLMFFLERIYSTCEDLRWFGKKAYAVWEDLPYHIQELEPFFTLDYADEPLSWGDEAQTRRLYETAFHYYDSK